jgi:hypothetical protein
MQFLDFSIIYVFEKKNEFQITEAYSSKGLTVVLNKIVTINAIKFENIFIKTRIYIMELKSCMYMYIFVFIYIRD